MSNESYFEAKFENSAMRDELIPDVEDDLYGKLWNILTIVQIGKKQ